MGTLILCHPCEIPLGPALLKFINRLWLITQLQLFLAGVPGQSGQAAATHAEVGRDSD